MIRRFLRSDDGRRLRNARELLREVPVKASVENVVVSGIIDLLYLNEENHWIILDFKTGTEHLENASQHGRYDFQMLLYAFLVAEATGRRPERAVVHFLGGGTSRSVSTTAEDVKRTGRRVAEIIAAIGGRQFARVAGVRCRQCEYHAVCMAAERESPTAPGGGAP
jgi:CRISPR/Cas system-associated exonuclease Cas4 (RecB family)